MKTIYETIIWYFCSRNFYISSYFPLPHSWHIFVFISMKSIGFITSYPNLTLKLQIGDIDRLTCCRKVMVHMDMDGATACFCKHISTSIIRFIVPQLFIILLEIYCFRTILNWVYIPFFLTVTTMVNNRSLPWQTLRCVVVYLLVE